VKAFHPAVHVAFSALMWAALGSAAYFSYVGNTHAMLVAVGIAIVSYPFRLRVSVKKVSREELFREVGEVESWNSEIQYMGDQANVPPEIRERAERMKRRLDQALQDAYDDIEKEEGVTVDRESGMIMMKRKADKQ
jgi:hypothetical protein